MATYRIDPKELEGMETLAVGYKVFNEDWKGYGEYCYADENGSVEGSVHRVDGDLEHCKNGLHFCQNPADCLQFKEPLQWNKYAKVSAFGEVKHHEDGKSECGILRIDKVLTFDEFIDAIKASNIYGGYDIHGGYNIHGGRTIYGGRNIHGGYNINGGSTIYGGYQILYCSDCEGISRSIFCYKKSGKLYVFNKKTNASRLKKIWDDLRSFNWYPKFTNAEELLVKYGGKWECVPPHRIKVRGEKEAYADMPQGMLEYIKAMPEFNAEIFKKITGIEV